MQHLDESVIGQDEAKETLAVAVYNHTCACSAAPASRSANWAARSSAEKSIMAGPSGTGKTCWCAPWRASSACPSPPPMPPP